MILKAWKFISINHILIFYIYKRKLKPEITQLVILELFFINIWVSMYYLQQQKGNMQKIMAKNGISFPRHQ